MNSSGWDKFRKQQAAEREQLQRLLLGMNRLLAKCRDTVPTLASKANSVNFIKT